MLMVEDAEDESTIDIWCPDCGLTHENYLDDDICKLAERIIENKVKYKYLCEVFDKIP